MSQILLDEEMRKMFQEKKKNIQIGRDFRQTLKFGN